MKMCSIGTGGVLPDDVSADGDAPVVGTPEPRDSSGGADVQAVTITAAATPTIAARAVFTSRISRSLGFGASSRIAGRRRGTGGVASSLAMRFVFIIGTGRCGSTLVQELLARHPGVGFISNVDSILAPLDLKGRTNPAIYARLPSALGRRDRAYLRHLRFTLAERVHLGPS